MYKTHIEQSFAKQQIEIYVYEENLNGGGCCLIPMPTGEAGGYVYGAGEQIKPLLIIDARIGKQMLDAFAETLDTLNIKTDKDAKIQGTLDATRYHLEDLRKLLALK